MDLAVSLGIRHLEIRTAYDQNVLLLDDEQLRQIRRLAAERHLSVLALASPLWKWCRPEASPGRVDSFNFPTRVSAQDRARWVDRALIVAQLLGARFVRVFSHLHVPDGLTETFVDDPLLPYALKNAERAGVQLLLENEPVCTLTDPIDLLHALDRHPGLGLWLDIGNLHEVGHGTTAAVAALAPRTEYLHIKDFRGPRGDGWKDFVAAGDGDVPYGSLLPAVHGIHPHLPHALETHVRTHPAKALARGAAFLRNAIPGGLE